MTGDGLIPLAEAAASLGIEPKRLLGFCMSRLPWMPIAGETPDGIFVYEWSLTSLRKQLATAGTSTVVNP